MRHFGAWGALVLLVLATGCPMLSKESAESVPTLEYPGWALALLGDDTTVRVRSTLRGRRGTTVEHAVEQLELREGPDGAVARVRVDRPLQRIVYDVVYDSEGAPLRFWRRVTVPGAVLPRIDLRLFELRVDPIAISHRDADGVVEYARMRRSESPIAVVGEAFTLLTHWIRKANLAVGDVVRGRALDTDKGGVMRNVALRRTEDLDKPEYGGRVRVYRIYGRDVFFANEDNVVIGSLSGFEPVDPAGPLMTAQARETDVVEPTRRP